MTRKDQKSKNRLSLATSHGTLYRNQTLSLSSPSIMDSASIKRRPSMGIFSSLLRKSVKEKKVQDTSEFQPIAFDTESMTSHRLRDWESLSLLELQMAKRKSIDDIPFPEIRTDTRTRARAKTETSAFTPPTLRSSSENGDQDFKIQRRDSKLSRMLGPEYTDMASIDRVVTTPPNTPFQLTLETSPIDFGSFISPTSPTKESLDLNFATDEEKDRDLTEMKKRVMNNVDREVVLPLESRKSLKRSTLYRDTHVAITSAEEVKLEKLELLEIAECLTLEEMFKSEIEGMLAEVEVDQKIELPEEVKAEVEVSQQLVLKVKKPWSWISKMLSKPKSAGESQSRYPTINITLLARLEADQEKIVYSKSHLKLAQSARPLHQQVLISNLMMYILSVHSAVTLRGRGPQRRKQRRKRRNLKSPLLTIITPSRASKLKHSTSSEEDTDSDDGMDDEDDIPLAMLPRKDT